MSEVGFDGDWDGAGLSAWLDDDPSRLHARDAEGRGLVAALAFAATGQQSIPLQPGPSGAEAALQVALDRGADPDLAGPDGWTALHTAAMSGHLGLIRQLLRGGASPALTAHGNPDATPLCWALFYGHTEAGRALATAARVPDGLRTAAALGDALDPWLRSDGALAPGAMGGRRFYRPSEGFPPCDPIMDRQTTLDESLTWAARNGQLGSMEALVRLGAEVNANPYRGTALLWATYSARHEAMRWLVAHGAEPDLRHDFGGEGHGQGATALHLAAQFGAHDTIRLLVSLGASSAVRDRGYDGTPEEWAYHCDQPEAQALLASL